MPAKDKILYWVGCPNCQGLAKLIPVFEKNRPIVCGNCGKEIKGGFSC